MISTCVYRVDVELVELLDARLGPPLDSYVRGWQVWLEEHGPAGATLEWRLHPPAGFQMPRGVNPHDLFEVVLQGVSERDQPDAGPFATGAEQRTLAQIWEVLEIFPTFGEKVSAEDLVEVVTDVLGRRPDAAGIVDHARLGDLYKASSGRFSVGRALLETLEPVGE